MQVLDSAVEEPANRIGATGAAWRLDANGSYRAASEIYFDRPPVNRSGSWTSLSKGFVLTGEPTTYFSTLSCGGSVYHNLDCDFLETGGVQQWALIQYPSSDWELSKLDLMSGE